MSKKRWFLSGIDDFKEAREGSYGYVDKSAFISELLESPSKITSITRPRRFGKTLNLSMLYYFFNFDKTSANIELFEGLKIKKSKHFNSHFGKYRVIFLTFKGIRAITWEECYGTILLSLSDLFRDHDYLLESCCLKEIEKQEYREVVERKADIHKLKNSLKDLTKYLERHHDQKVILLVDEYDTPIIEGELNGYYQNVLSFIQNLLGNGLKGNTSLFKGVMTGITKLQGAGIFGGLNNVDTCTIFSKNYSDKFGFTESEVRYLLIEYGASESEEDVKRWYNGYNFGGDTIYNPYSVAKYLESGEILNSWVASGENRLVESKIATLFDESRSEETFKVMEKLMQREAIEIMVKDDLKVVDANNLEDILNLFLSSGYLKYESYTRRGVKRYATVSIPNSEVEGLYAGKLENWLGAHYRREGDFKKFLDAIVDGGEEEIKAGIEGHLAKRSIFDVERVMEMSYHNFIFGMLQGLGDGYNVNSNEESGEGRCDFILTPVRSRSPLVIDSKREGIVIEFKVGEEDNLKKVSQMAVKQVEDRKYLSTLREKGIKNIRIIGIAFFKKQAEVAVKKVL